MHSTPLLEGCVSEYCRTVLYGQKYDGVVTQQCKNFEDMFNCFDRIRYRRVMDREMDRQTPCDSIDRIMHSIGCITR